MALRDKYHARPGGHGNKNNRHGKNATPFHVEVPVGTVVKNNNGQIIADLNEHKSEFLIACGGAGGYDAVFYRTYPLLYHKFGNMVIFRSGK